MEQDKPFSLVNLQQALLLPGQEQLTTVTTLRPRGRGRAAILAEKLKNITAVNKTNIKKPSLLSNAYLGTVGTVRNVISNAILLQVATVFEYDVSFEPSLKEEMRESFLKKYFANFSEMYLYYNGYVYTPKELQDKILKGSLFNKSLFKLITVRLSLRRKADINSCRDLLNKVFECLNSLKIIYNQSLLKIVEMYKYSLRQCKAGQMLCMDCSYFTVYTKTVQDEVLRLKSQFPQNYCKALEVLLNKFYLYNEIDGEIYKLFEIAWKHETLRLKKPNMEVYIDASFANCYLTEAGYNTKPYIPTAGQFMSDIRQLTAEPARIWNLQLENFTVLTTRVLPAESITFGDGVTCTPTHGAWQKEMLQNEVVTSIELWCWVIFHQPEEEQLAKLLGHNIQTLSDDTGVSIGKPIIFPIKNDTLDGYVSALESIINGEVQLIIILVPETKNKPDTLVKHICCVQKPVPCQLISSFDVRNLLKLHQTILLINAMLGGTLWTVSLPCKNWMITGINMHHSFDGVTPPVCSFVASFSDDASQWYNKAVFIEQDFKYYFKNWLDDTLKKYRSTNGNFPTHLIIYHSCTEDTKTQIHNDYLAFNFEESGNLKVCVILVQKDVNTSYFKNLKSGYCNVPNGTLVDDVITNSNSRDFFLVSHEADREISKPTYYDVIRDTCDFTPDQIQTLTYKLCHLCYERTRVAEMPAPCIYAEKLSKLVGDTIRHVPSPVLDEYLFYL